MCVYRNYLPKFSQNTHDNIQLNNDKKNILTKCDTHVNIW